MKAPPFVYLRPDSLDACLEALSEYGDDAQPLAGGQSLMPMMNLRLAAPTALIDINRLTELKSITVEDDQLIVGAGVTHQEIAASEAVRRHAPLLTAAAPHIAHVAIRSRGTIGGSVALADPAAEWPACCFALDAEIELASAAGRRRVPADAFFQGLYTTDRRPEELVTAIRIPRTEDKVYAFEEVSRRRGDFAIAGAAIVCDQAEPAVMGVRIAMFGVVDRPVLARRAMATIEDQALTDEAIDQAARTLTGELDPPEDPAYPADYRRNVASGLLARTLRRLMTERRHAD